VAKDYSDDQTFERGDVARFEGAYWQCSHDPAGYPPEERTPWAYPAGPWRPLGVTVDGVGDLEEFGAEEG